MHDLRQKLYFHIQRMSPADYDRNRTGDLISRVTSDIEAIQTFIASSLLGAFIDVITLLGILAKRVWRMWKSRCAPAASKPDSRRSSR